MDYLLGHSNEKFRKCGEITTGLNVGKKIYAFNCGFCSKVFFKLHAFTVHVGETHEPELFGSLDDESDELTINDRNEDITMEIKFVEITKKAEETVIDFQDPLEALPISEECIVLDIKAEDDTVEHGNNYNDDVDFSSESDNETDYLDEDNDTKELTLAVISGFEKHHILWDSSKPMAKTRKKRIEAHKIIATSINKQMGMNLKWVTIRDRIKNLRSKFRSELQKRKHAESRGKNYNPIWYYDKLSFLNESVKCKPKIKNSEKTLAIQLPYLTDAQNLELIEIYKSFPCLWDVQHIEFHFKNKREKALNEILQEIKTKTNLHLTKDEVQRIIQNIRDKCTQEKYRKLNCERLNKMFTPMCKFYEQISFLENNVNPFKCDFCGESFNGYIKYKKHKSTHDGLMPFICPICNRGYMSAAGCTVHVRRHTGDYPFECMECKKTYAVASDLKKHVRGHTGEKPYFCEICGKSFRTWSLFDIHLRRHQKRPGHVCTICSKAFYRKALLIGHMNGHLNIRDKVCTVCGKAFTCSKYLQQHKQIHADKKKYVCKICGKDFAQYAGLSGHMKSHGTAINCAIMVENSL